jgi:regulatory protein
LDDQDRCYQSALRILKYRFNSAAELRRKLRAKGFERDIIDATLSRLAAEKWLDDARFAAAYVRTRAQKRKGRLRIRRELIGAGVANDVIEKAVSENVDSEDEHARARALAEKRLVILSRRYEPHVVRNKLTAYLLNQGYDAALVREILKEMKVAQY